jgi:hypothetical protein
MVMETKGHEKRLHQPENTLQVSDTLEEERGQRQDAFLRALVGGEPAVKGVTIYANS